MIETKIVEKVKTLILFSITFLKNRAIYEIMWKNIKLGWPRMTKWHMHFSCVIFIAFLLQLWLCECTSLLRCTCIACLVSLEYSRVGMAVTTVPSQFAI